MRKNVLALAFFVTLFGISLITPIVDFESVKLSPTESQSFTVSGIGDNTEDYVDSLSDLHAPSDIGTHDVFSDLQADDTNYDALTEANQGVIGNNVHDTVDSDATDVDSDPDVGTQGTFANAQDLGDADYMTVQEADLGFAGVNENLDCSGFDGTYTDWTTVGSSPYLDAQDQPTNYIYTITTNGNTGYFTFPSTSLTSGSATVTLYVYCNNDDGAGNDAASVFYNIGAGDVDTGVDVGDHNTWSYDTVSLGSLTVAQINALQIRFQYVRAPPADDVRIDHIYINVYAPATNDFELEFEYQFTSVDYDEVNEEVCINVQTATQGTENLEVYEWDGASSWYWLGTIDSDGWNNFTASYITSSTYTIEIRDNERTDEGTQSTWNIDSILLHVWTVPTYDYELDLEVGWTAADFDETNEELCIYPVTGGGWPAEDIIVDVWDSAWTTVFTDLIPDQWNNISISSYLTDATFEIRFIGGTETGDASQSTWEIDAVLIHTWTPSYAPVNDQAPTLDNPSDTDNMYAQYVGYQITVYASDQNGYTDIDYLEIELWNDARDTQYCTFRYDEDTNTFTEEYDIDTAVALDAATSSAVESGNDIDATFNFTVDWDFPDSTDLDVRCYVVDTQAESDSDWYDNPDVTWDVETRLDYSVGPTITDGTGTADRGALDGSFSLTGTVIYYTSGDDYPSSAAVDVWVSASEYGTVTGPWSDLTLSSGTFDVTCYADDLVGQDTYTVKVVEEGLGSGAADLYHTPSATDTYIADQLIVSITDPLDQRIDTGENATGIIVAAIYDYDDSAFDGSLTLNDTTFLDATFGKRGYTVSSASGGSHGVSLIGVNDETYCIWDSLTVTITDTPDQRININTNATGILVTAVYDYDGTAFDGTLTLNNTVFSYSDAQIQYYTVQTVTGGAHGITAISSNDITFCIWDSLTITITDTPDQRININTNATGILVTAVYDYDGTAFDGLLTLNNTVFSYSDAQIQWYTVTTASGDSHGITAINVNDNTYCIWDSLTITITDTPDQRININTNATGIIVSAVYDYDGTAFDGLLTLNNTVFSYSDAQIQWYTVTTASGDTYGITAINVNDNTYCIWDSLTITITDTPDQRININANATGIIVSAVYDYDGTTFEGTLTLNNTIFSYSDAQIQWYTVNSVSGGAHSITSINVNDNTYCIWDSLTISITDPLDQRQNVNINATGIIVSAVYDSDGTTFDGILTLNNTVFSYSDAQIQWYTVTTASGDSHDITAINVNDNTYCIWDSLTITITDPSDQRININANATGIIVSAVYDYDGTAFDGLLTLNNTVFSYSDAQIQWYTVTTVSGDTYGITAINVNDNTYCIWDSLTITINGPDDPRINIDTAATGIVATAVYDYDGAAFDGSLTLNNTQFTYSDAQIQWYTVESVSGGSYDITAINVNDNTYCIWDSLTISITDPLDQRQNVNTNATGIIVTAVYDYDGSTFDGIITLNNTVFSYSDAQIQWYTVTLVSGGTHGITTINVNDETYFIWDSLTVTVTDPGDQRINIDTNATGIFVTAVYDYDGSVFDGTLTLNNTVFSYSDAQIQWYTVESASGDSHGITAINVNDNTFCIWDSLTIVISNPIDQRININANATGITVTGVYDYDGTVFDGTLTLNNTLFDYPMAQKQGYRVNTISGGLHGISAVSTDDETYCIWDSLTVTVTDLGDQRININTNATGIIVTAVYDYDGSNFDGTLTLNNTVFSYANPQIQWYTVESVSGGSHGITAINVNDATYSIWDRVIVIGYSVIDGRVNINDNVDLNVTVEYEYDGTPVTDGALSVNGAWASHVENGIWRLTVNSSTVGQILYQWVQCYSNLHGITEENYNSQSQTVIWDRIQILTTTTDDGRINYGAQATIAVTAQLEFDSHPLGGSDALYLNDSLMSWNGTHFILNPQFSQVGRWTFFVNSTGANEVTHGISAVFLDNNEVDQIWDRIQILTTTASDGRISRGTESTTINVTAQLEYDSHMLTSGDSLYLNGVLMTWDTDHFYAVVGPYVVTDKFTYYVNASGANEVSFGITAINVGLNSAEVISDRLDITIGVDEATPFNDIQVNFSLTVVYEYDGLACPDYQIVIQRNGTWWHSFTDTNFSQFVDTNSDIAYEYAVRVVTSESTYDIFSFSSVLQTVVWSTIPNNIPVLDTDAHLTNPDSSFMLARYNYYKITSNVSDADGYIDIQYVELTLYDNTSTTPIWTVRYTVIGGVFSIEFGSEFINLGSSSATMSGSDLDIVWSIKISWGHPDMINMVPHQYVTDGTDTASDFGGETWNVETRLDYSIVPSLSDDRGDLDTADLIATGAVTYIGLAQTPFGNETDVWVVHDVSGSWSGDLSAGSFSISSIGSSSIVRLNTYTFKIVSQGNGTLGSDLYYTTSVTDTFITDQLVVSITDPADQRINIGENATTIIVTAIYDYDDSPFDGTLTLNDTTFNYGTFGRRDYTVQSVFGGIHGVSVIGINDVTYCIWDSLTISISDPSDPRINIGENATGIIVSAVYDYDGSIFDGTLTLNDTVFSYGDARIQWYTVNTVSGGTLGISAINVNDFTYCIWDSLTISITDPIDQRQDVNVNATGIFVTAVYDYDGSLFDGILTLNNTVFDYPDAQIQWYTVDSVSGGAHGITAISLNDGTFFIWDSLTITLNGPDDPRIDIDTATTGIVATAVYDYDGAAFDGTLTLNNTQFTYSTAQRQWYTVESASGDTLGITAISTNDATYCIWDSLTITITDPVDSHININTAAVGITASAVYDYDGVAFDGTLTLNNTQFTYSTAQIQWYIVESASGGTHGISVINVNDQTFCIWDQLVIVIGVDDASPLNGHQANFTLSVRYAFDGENSTGYQIVIDRNTTWWHSFTDVNWSQFVDTNADLTYFYNVSLISSEAEGITAFTTNTVKVTWSLAPNELPVNDSSPVLTNADDTDYLYARYRHYVILTSVSDLDGYADISYVELTLYSDGGVTPYWTVRYTVGTGIFSVESGGSIVEIGVMSNTVEVLNTITITWHLKIGWGHPDVMNTDVLQYVTDGTDSDSDLYDEDWNVETRLDYSVSPTLLDDRGDIDTSDLIATGSVTYYNSGHIPLSNETDVWVVHDVSGAWSGNLAAGSFSISNIGSSSSVRLNTYTFKIVSQGNGSLGSDLYYTTSLTDTFITDAIEIFEAGVVNGRININTDCEVWWKARYVYDGTEIQSDLTIELNGSRTLVWDGVNLYWRWQEQSATPGYSGFEVAAASESFYGLTVWVNTTSVQQVIWDALIITMTDPSDLRIDVGTNASGILVTAVYAFDGAVYDGTFTLNNTNFQYASPQKQGYTVTAASGDSFDISTILTNDATSCIWDRVLIVSVDADELYHDLVDDVVVTVELRYEYDGSPVLVGSFAIVGHPLSHVGAGVWEAQVTVGSYQPIDFDDLTTCDATLHGISEYNMDSNTVTVYWDRLEFYSVSVDDDRINVGASTDVQWSVRLEHAGISITTGVSAQMTGGITLTPSAGIYSASVTASAVGSSSYSIISATLGEIGEFVQSASNAQVIWDQVIVTSISATILSLDRGAATEIHVTLEYVFDSTDVTTGQVYLDDGGASVPMSYDPSGYWSVSVSKTVPGNYSFSVDSVSGNTHGITSLDTDDLSVEVEWVGAPGFVLDTMTLMVIGGGAGIGVLGLAIVASRRRKSGVVPDIGPLEPSDLGVVEPVAPDAVEPEVVEPDVVDEAVEPEEVELPPVEDEIVEPEVEEIAVEPEVVDEPAIEPEVFEEPEMPEEPVAEPEVEPEYPDYDEVPEEFVEPTPEVDLSRLTKKELLELIPDDIKETTSPKELKRLTKQELISLVESFKELEE